MRIGEYTLHPCMNYPNGRKSVWIEQADGEGGQFDAEKLEKLIRKFYDANF